MISFGEEAVALSVDAFASLLAGLCPRYSHDKVLSPNRRLRGRRESKDKHMKYLFFQSWTFSRVTVHLAALSEIRKWKPRVSRLRAEKERGT